MTGFLFLKDFLINLSFLFDLRFAYFNILI